MTLLILIFSEITPKTYAIKNAEKTALISAPMLSVLVKIFYPITKRIQAVINFVIDPDKSESKESLVSDIDEIRGTIELKHKKGSMFKYDKDMISNILDLGDIEISDIAVHRKNIKSINIEQNLNIYIGLATIVFWFVGISALWAFMERIGVDLGYSSENIGQWLALGMVLGVVSALFVSWKGKKLGYYWPPVACIAVHGFLMLILANIQAVSA